MTEKIEIYIHEVDGIVYYTDNPDATSTTARCYAPFGLDDGEWFEVDSDGQFIMERKYEYWPSNGLLVEQ